MKEVKVYTSESCVPCISLKRYLKSKGVFYTELDADKQENANQLIELTGRRVVPTTVIDGNVITGLNYGALARALNG